MSFFTFPTAIKRLNEGCVVGRYNDDADGEWVYKVVDEDLVGGIIDDGKVIWFDEEVDFNWWDVTAKNWKVYDKQTA